MRAEAATVVGNDGDGEGDDEPLLCFCLCVSRWFQCNTVQSGTSPAKPRAVITIWATAEPGGRRGSGRVATDRRRSVGETAGN